MDSRVAGWPAASRWKRRLVRNGSPSPANMRAGASPVPLEREHPCGERESARQVLLAQEPHQLAVVGRAGQRDPRHRGAGQRRRRQRGVDLPAAHGVAVARRRSTARPPPGHAASASAVSGEQRVGRLARQIPGSRRRSAVARPGAASGAVCRCWRRRASSACSAVAPVVAAHCLARSRPGTAPAAGGTERRRPRRDPGVDRRQPHRCPPAGPRSREQPAQLLVQRGDAVVVEARGAGAEHRHLVPRRRRRPRGCAPAGAPRRAARPPRPAARTC